DEEENGLRGSSAYVKEYGVADLTGLINMELVGLGDRFALWPVPKGIHGRLLDGFEISAAAHQIKSDRFDRIITNTADHEPFRKAGLFDSFTITCISSKDEQIAHRYYAMLNFGASRQELEIILSQAPIFEHYHKSTDTFENIHE